MENRYNWSLFLGMITNTKTAVQDLMQIKPKSMAIIISIMFGFSLQLDFASANSLGDTDPLWSILINSLIYGVVIGLLYVLIFSSLVYWIGQILGGEASWNETFVVVGWSGIPFAIKLVSWLIKISVYGNSAFSNDISLMEGNLVLISLFVILTIIEFILSIIYFLIIFKSIKEMHRFSTAKGLITLALCLFVFIIGQLILSSLFSSIF